MKTFWRVLLLFVCASTVLWAQVDRGTDYRCGDGPHGSRTSRGQCERGRISNRGSLRGRHNQCAGRLSRAEPAGWQVHPDILEGWLQDLSAFRRDRFNVAERHARRKAGDRQSGGQRDGDGRRGVAGHGGRYVGQHGFGR